MGCAGLSGIRRIAGSAPGGHPAGCAVTYTIILNARRAQRLAARATTTTMQEIFFFDQGDTALPREKVRIEQTRAEPYPDGRRLRVTVVLTPFSEKPNLRLTISNTNGDTVAEADVLELVTRKTELTMHLRDRRAQANYTLRTELYYDDAEPQDVLSLSFASVGEG